MFYDYPMTYTLSITNQETTKAVASGADEVVLVYQNPYEEGDTITLKADHSGFVVCTMDGTLAPTLLYLDGTYTLPIPFNERRVCYDPNAFQGNIHYLTVRGALPAEKENYHNLALNPMDCHANKALFPHAYANVETRGEASFEARNAIDGIKANHGHGHWPYSSWGINRDPKATLTIDFGRQVKISEVVVYTRADFPHDAWWVQADLTTDEGTTTIKLAKTDSAQRFKLEKPATTRTLTVSNLVKADDPSPFPALTQIEAWGTEA